MRRFQSGALSKRSHDSLMDQGEKANVGHLFATGDLQALSVSETKGKIETTNVSSGSFH